MCVACFTCHYKWRSDSQQIKIVDKPYSLLTFLLRAINTLEFSGLYVICIKGKKGSCWGVKLFPKSSETKILEPWFPDTSAVRITWKFKNEIGCELRFAVAWNLWQLPKHVTYFSRVLRADGNTELWSDKGVVDQVGNILKWLPIILTATQMLALENQTQTVSMCNNNKTGQTFCRVWTDQLLTWRWGPEMWSKPGWPTKEKINQFAENI